MLSRLFLSLSARFLCQHTAYRHLSYVFRMVTRKRSHVLNLQIIVCPLNIPGMYYASVSEAYAAMSPAYQSFLTPAQAIIKSKCSMLRGSRFSDIFLCFQHRKRNLASPGLTGIYHNLVLTSIAFSFHTSPNLLFFLTMQMFYVSHEMILFSDYSSDTKFFHKPN